MECIYTYILWWFSAGCKYSCCSLLKCKDSKFPSARIVLRQFYLVISEFPSVTQWIAWCSLVLVLVVFCLGSEHSLSLAVEAASWSSSAPQRPYCRFIGTQAVKMWSFLVLRINIDEELYIWLLQPCDNWNITFLGVQSYIEGFQTPWYLLLY